MDGVIVDPPDFDPNTSAHLTVTGVDGAAGNVGNALQGQYGTLTLNADGSYTYVASNTLPSQIVSDNFTYSINDGHGGTNSSTLTIAVLNSNQSYQAGSNTTLTSVPKFDGFISTR